MLDPFAQPLEPTLLGTRTCITHGLQSLMGCILPMMHCSSQHCWELLQPFAQCWELLHLFALSWTHITEHSKTSKWVLKLQFLTLSKTTRIPSLSCQRPTSPPPAPPPPNPRLLNPRFLQMEGSKEKQSSGPGCSNMPESPIQWINH